MLKPFTFDTFKLSRSATKQIFGIHQHYCALNYNQSHCQRVEVRKALEGWYEKLKDAGVGDIEFNLKCLVAHVLKRKFVSKRKFTLKNFSQNVFVSFKYIRESLKTFLINDGGHIHFVNMLATLRRKL